MPPPLTGREVLENATFQELALHAADDDAAALAKHAHVIENMDVMHVQWLVLPAIKSGGTDALRALGDKIWADAAFRADARQYAATVDNRAAMALLDQMQPVVLE